MKNVEKRNVCEMKKQQQKQWGKINAEGEDDAKSTLNCASKA